MAQQALTDEELAAELGFGTVEPEAPEKVARAMAKMDPKKRASLENLVLVARQLALYEKGLAPKPAGVMVDWDRSKRGGR